MPLHLLARGILQRGVAHTPTACLTFATVTVLPDGSLLATWRAGSTKDSDDETIWFARSQDNGATWGAPWSPFAGCEVDGLWGTPKLCYLTVLAPDHLIAAAMWVDRATYPGQPLFNPDTEGCLPMFILLAASHDPGATWSPWRKVPMPNDIGPASLTGPLLKLADGALAMSIETNKHYHDRNPWRQKVVFFHSSDQGRTWSAPSIAGQDPSGRIFNWDLRAGVAPDGRVVSFAWTYDSTTARYLAIHRRVSRDHGHTWSNAEPLPMADQAGHPAILPDGRIALAYVDRFNSRTIRVGLAHAVDAPFNPADDLELYNHAAPPIAPPIAPEDTTGALLADMSLWTFGLPYAETLPNGDVLVTYYAGHAHALDLHWARLAV